MLTNYSHIQPRPPKNLKPLVLDNFRLGLNTSLSAAAIQQNEASMLVNFKFLPTGGIETREGLTRYTTSVLTNDITHIAFFPFDIDLSNLRIFADTADREWENSAGRQWVVEVPASSGTDELIVTQPDNKLYLLNSSKAPVEKATLKGDAIIIPFGDKALICDGSYLKYWDKNTDTVKIAYDDGSGSDGYQYNNTALTPDTHIKLYSGGNTKAGVSFETQDWDSGYTITITTVEIYALKSGSPTGSVGCELYLDSNDSLVATATTTYSAADINTVSEKLTFTFASGAMSPLTIYNAVLTYSGGDVSNYIQLECDTTTASGDTKYYDGAWNDDALKYAVVGVKPGRPPCASYGIVQANRIFLAGDSYNKGVMWYSNLNTPFDWSTTNGGGWIGVIDDNPTNYPTGGIVSFYGVIYIFGKQSQPYLCKLTGSSPTDFAISPIFQRIYSTHKTAINTINDLWFGNESGVNALSGVEQYGDLRSSCESDPVDDRIKSYWTDDDAFAGYYGATGQYFLKQKNYARCLVAHTKNPTLSQGRVRYPWTEYVFVKEDLSSATYKWTASATSNEYYCELTGGGDPSLSEPSYLLFQDSISTNGTVGSLADHGWDYGDNDTLGYSTIYIRDDSGDPDTTDVRIQTVIEATAFANYRNNFFVACDDGYIYTLDTTVEQDNSVDVPYVLGGKMFESPYNEVCLEKYDVSCGTEATGATLDLEIYNSDLDIDTLHSASTNASFSITINSDFNRNLNANYKKFLPILRNFSLDGEPLRINNISLIMRSLNM